MKTRAFLTVALTLILAALIAEPSWLAATVQQQPQFPDPGIASGMNKRQQEQAGLQVMAEVYKQMPVLPDSSQVTRYVQQLGRKLVAVIPQDKSWPYQFHVIPQKEINAFALPGGPIFINLGTLQAADSEAELAGVMAHEMSHVYMQHSAKRVGKTSVARSILGILGAILPGNTAGNIARLGIQIGAGTVLMKYSRDDEAQADAVGAIIMYKAGFDPKAMAQFFEKLEQQGGGNGPQFLSDHPNPGNREAAVESEIQNWPPKNYFGTSPAFASAKQQARGIETYTAQQIADGAKQGVWARQNAQNGATPSSASTTDNAGAQSGSIANLSYGQVRPSGQFTQLQHSAFSISYPSNWQAADDQNSTVTIAPQGAASQGATAYGVIIGGLQDQNASSIDQAMEDLIQNLQQSNPGMQV
ncbi:MAG TPA: M48 family metallopeptidase, partial [Candidatus Acidoferrales bacterium]|nr:M48 family metallopeptidase [Candidatus Acidoferrales bacterium]